MPLYTLGVGACAKLAPMLDVRDLTDHPGAAAQVSAPKAREALEGLGFHLLGHVELPLAESQPLREVLTSPDGQVVSLQWTSQGKELGTLVSLLEDGTVLETDRLPGPKLLRALLKPGYPALGFRMTQGPSSLSAALEHHRRFVSAQAGRRGSLPVPLGTRRQVLAVLERKARAEAAMLVGTLLGVAVGLLCAASYLYWVGLLTVQDRFVETMQALTPEGLPVKLVVVAPLLLVVLASVLWPLVFTRIPLGKPPRADELWTADSGANRQRPASGATEAPTPSSGRWLGSTLRLGVPLPLPPLVLVGLVVSPLVAAVAQYARPAGFAEEQARRLGVDDRAFGDWTEAVFLLGLTLFVVALLVVRQRLEITDDAVSFRPWSRAFARRTHPRSALLAVWLRAPITASRWAAWEVLIVLQGDELPLVVRADRRPDRGGAERVAADLARRLGTENARPA